MTALNLYGVNTASATLSTAEQLVNVSGGGTTTGVGTRVGTSTGWGELFSQGTTTNWAAAGAMGTPSGNGWLFDTNALENCTLSAGTYTISEYFFNNGSNSYSVTTISVNLYKRSSGGVYTLIGSCTLSSQTITTSSTLFTLSGSLSSMAFGAGDKLYKDIWLNVASGGSGATVKIHTARSSSATVGASGFAEVDTPGYGPTNPVHLFVFDGLSGVFS